MLLNNPKNLLLMLTPISLSKKEKSTRKEEDQEELLLKTAINIKVSLNKMLNSPIKMQAAKVEGERLF